MVEAKRNLTDDPVVLRIIELLKEQEKTDKELIEHLGIGRNSIVSWKYGKIKSYRAHINEIAEFLDVTPNYLLRGTDSEVNIETLSETEIQLVKGFRTADRNGQRHILELIQYIKDATKDFEGERRTG